MNLFGLEGIGFIISLAMTLLICGAIMFYCLRRFKVLETNILEQGNILKSFIMKQQVSGFNQTNNLANTTALESAKQQTSIVSNNKIEVSEDDYETSDNETSDDDSSDDERLLNTDNNVLDIKTIIDNTINKEITLTTQELKDDDVIKDLDETTKMIQLDDITDITDMNSINNDDNDDNDDNKIDNISDSDSEDSDDYKIKDFAYDNHLDLESNNVTSETVKEDLENTDKKKNDNFRKMKVDELRDLVVSKSIDSSENVKSMKRDQLIKLLTKK